MARQDPPEFAVAPLDDQHDRNSFTCGVDSLDRYFKTQAGQDMRRKANAVFVMVGCDDPSTVLGYFTLCATSLEQGAVPETARKHVPRYPLVSATLLGRLAVSFGQQGKGLGSVLLGFALHKAFASASSVGSSMVVVDAVDERAVCFYEAHGFVRLAGSLRLAIAMQTIARTLAG